MTPRFLETQTVLNVQKVAMAHGGIVREPRSRLVEWDVSGNCQSPVRVELNGRKRLFNEKGFVVTGSRPETLPRFVDIDVRCRKCSNCLRVKALQWRLRSRGEYGQSVRTWLCTLTLNPAAHTTMLYRAALRLSKSGVKIDALPDAEQFAERETESFRELQKWMKRLRKNSGSKIRYLAITEKHMSGLPHYHVLLHEQDPEGPVRYDNHLKASWPLGFGHYKLVRDVQAAAYVCKYLSKSPEARVRASAHYGNASSVPSAALALPSPGGVPG